MPTGLDTLAVVLEEPKRLHLSRLDLTAPRADDAVVEVAWSGISTGTERLLWLGRMPLFPGLGYPLVPGYESVGRVVEAGNSGTVRVDDWVFVPGANCFGAVRGLFGGAAARLVVPDTKLVPLDPSLGERGTLLALAATAYHAILAPGATPPDLIIGHGVLGRLLARLTVLAGKKPPVVWEKDLARRAGSDAYPVLAPEEDPERGYAVICDASGDAGVLDTLIARLARGGEIILAGFYAAPLTFAFPPAFLRETRLRVAAEWQPADLAAVKLLVESGELSLDGLITHRCAAAEADQAYRTAFEDPLCLKMVLDWRLVS